MKLQHTSGAVIENNLLKETEGLYPAFVQYDAFDKVEENSTSAYLRLPNHDRSRIGMVGLPRLPKLRYRIVDGNLCVERRVEGI